MALSQASHPPALRTPPANKAMRHMPSAADPLATLPESLDFLRPDHIAEHKAGAKAFFVRHVEQAALERQWHFSHFDRLENKGLLETPATDALLSDLSDLLHVSTNRSALNSGQQLRNYRRDLPLRRLLQTIDKHSVSALRAAREALEQLAEQTGVFYTHEYIFTKDMLGWKPMTFARLTDEQVASTAYLDWAIQASELPWSSQARLEALLEEDAELQWRSNHARVAMEVYSYNEVSDAEIAQHEEDLAADESRFQARVDRSTEDIRRVLAARPFEVNKRPRKRISSEGLPWTVFAHWLPHADKYDTPPWPFVRAEGRATGDLPSSSLLAREARRRRTLGQLLRMPADHWFAREDDIPGLSPQELKALEFWIALADAGLVLRVAGATLQQLADASIERQRCKVCWRHLPPSGRLHCDVHLPRPGVRSDSDRLAVWAERRDAQWVASLMQVWQPEGPLEDSLETVVDRITQAWQSMDAFEMYMDAQTRETSNRRQALNARKEDTPAPKPTPEQINEQLTTLNQLLTDLHRFTEGAVSTRLQEELARATARARTSTEPWALHPIKFFGDYFSGHSQEDNTAVALPPDTAHPIGSERRQRIDKRASGSKPHPDVSGYLARDLIRDLFAQRVWSEVGGDIMDAKAERLRHDPELEIGEGYISSPVHRGSKIDEAQAKRWKEDGKSQAWIAKELGVSAAAVSLFFKRMAK